MPTRGGRLLKVLARLVSLVERMVTNGTYVAGHDLGILLSVVRMSATTARLHVGIVLEPR